MTVYVIQEMPYKDILSAEKYGELLLTGDPAIIGVACAVASDINMGRFKVLKWDRRREKYLPLEIDITGRRKNDEI